MKTFTSPNLTASQNGTGLVQINGRLLEPDEAKRLGEWLMTVEVPAVKPETRGEIDLKEIKGVAKQWPVKDW